MSTTRPSLATGPRLRASNIDFERVVLGVVGGAACVTVTLALAAGHLAGTGPQALAAALFVLLVVWCFARGRVDQTLALLALYLGLLDGYVKLRTGGATITIARDVLVMAIAAGALVRASTSRQRLALPPLGGLVLAFCGVILVELAHPGARNLAGGIAGVRQHLEFVPLFFLGFAFIRLDSQIRMCLVLLVICAAIGGVVSYLQSGMTPQELATWGPGYAERVLGSGGFTNSGRVAVVDGTTAVRPFGLGSDAGAGGLFAAIALPALIALTMVGSSRARLLVMPVAAGVAVGLATSGGRNTVVVAFVSLIAFGLLAARGKTAIRAVVGLGIVALMMYGAFTKLSSDNLAAKRTQSIVSANVLSTYREERGESLALLGTYVKEHPFGAGLGRQGPAAGAFEADGPTLQQNAETEWNFLVLEAGVLGLGIYLLINLRLFAWACTRLRLIRDIRRRMYLAALAAPLAGLVAQGFSGPTTASVPAAPYFWLVAGILSYWLTAEHGSGSGSSLKSASQRR